MAKRKKKPKRLHIETQEKRAHVLIKDVPSNCFRIAHHDRLDERTGRLRPCYLEIRCEQGAITEDSDVTVSVDDMYRTMKLKELHDKLYKMLGRLVMGALWKMPEWMKQYEDLLSDVPPGEAEALMTAFNYRAAESIAEEVGKAVSVNAQIGLLCTLRARGLLKEVSACPLEEEADGKT